jgi:RNA polymerase sigma-70 factor (ECF subfamily)
MSNLNIDKNLIISAKNGSLTALDAIIVAYQRAIYSHLYRLVNNAEDAADLAQETFIKLYKNRDKIDPEQNFNAWLYKIATNTAYDWIKKKKRHPEDLIIDDGDFNFETIEAEQSYYKMPEIDRVGLEMALAKIKPILKNLLLLYYQQGFSYEEISVITDTPLNTVKVGLHRAKKELFKHFN